MAILQKKVKCSICGTLVPLTATRLVDPLSLNKSYECHSCFKDKKTSPLSRNLGQKPIKKELFCSYCKYKFTSSRKVCPYCGKAEYLVPSNLKAVDFLN